MKTNIKECLELILKHEKDIIRRVTVIGTGIVNQSKRCLSGGDEQGAIDLIKQINGVENDKEAYMEGKGSLQQVLGVEVMEKCREVLESGEIEMTLLEWAMIYKGQLKKGVLEEIEETGNENNCKYRTFEYLLKV